MKASTLSTNRENTVTVQNGWVWLPIVILLELGSLALFIHSIAVSDRHGGHPDWLLFVVGLLGMALAVVLMCGLFTLQPNEARVLVLFGKYKGTVRQSGFHWGNPFYTNGLKPGAVRQALTKERLAESAAPTRQSSRNKVSLRVRNLNSDKLKVNDKRGNPIEIAAVIVWRVEDTAQAMFDVDDYETYVRIQSESAIRHLAYAPEIAQAMLRRQQAEAVIAARQKIVQGAVSMVDMALKELADKHVVHLDDERRAAMVSNLMVVLCGEAEVHPVVNTGTLYS